MSDQSKSRTAKQREKLEKVAAGGKRKKEDKRWWRKRLWGRRERCMKKSERRKERGRKSGFAKCGKRQMRGKNKKGEIGKRVKSRKMRLKKMEDEEKIMESRSGEAWYGAKGDGEIKLENVQNVLSCGQRVSRDGQYTGIMKIRNTRKSSPVRE